MCTVSKQTTNKQTKKDVWAFNKSPLNHLISQNVHHISHNKGIQNEVAGAWFAWIFMLIMLIGTGISNFISVHWFQWHDQGSVLAGRPKCLHHRLAPLPQAADELTSWEQNTKLHTKEHVLYGLFRVAASWCSFCSFSVETLSHISTGYCPIPDEHFHNN